jgi:hypothetical protein
MNPRSTFAKEIATYGGVLNKEHGIDFEPTVDNDDDADIANDILTCVNSCQLKWAFHH